MKYPTPHPERGTTRYCPPFTPMVEVLQPAQLGAYALEAFTVSEDAARLENLRGMFAGHNADLDAGRYMRLRGNGHVWMSDTPRERKTNLELLYHAHGAVLIGGLGLGMVLPPLLRKPEVARITVIELEAEVIALVGAQFTDARVQIIQGDMRIWRPAKGVRYNTIWLDIWPDICTDNWADVKHLCRVFTSYLDRNDPARWLGAWERDYLRYLLRRG